jgi:hypothetical protein
MMEAYRWPYCVERMRPRTRWRAVYDELYAGLASGEDARSRDAASLVLPEKWSAIMEALRRAVRNARRKERYGERYRIRQAERGAHVYPI